MVGSAGKQSTERRTLSSSRQPEDPVHAPDPEPGVMPVRGLISGQDSLRRTADPVDPLGGSTVPPDIVAELRRSTGGEPLPERVAGPLSDHFGQDLSALRVHADTAAARMTNAMQATAFTHGEHLYFAPGAYRPETSQGQRLVAHEVSHVVAQRTGVDRGGASGLTVGRADDPAEAAADRAADAAMGSLRRSAAG